MVAVVKAKGQPYYLCSVCHLAYRERQWAQRCEEFCTQFKGCSIEITQHAVDIPPGEQRLPKG